MKVLAILAALVAVAIARPNPNFWTLQEIDAALQNPNLKPSLRPVLEDALNKIMHALFEGHDVEGVLMPIAVDSAILEEIPGNVVSDQPAAQSNTPLVQIIVNVSEQQEETIHEILPPILVIDDDKPENVIAPPEVNPIDVIAVNPVQPNPIDAIHVQPLPILN